MLYMLFFVSQLDPGFGPQIMHVYTLQFLLPLLYFIRKTGGYPNDDLENKKKKEKNRQNINFIKKV